MTNASQSNEIEKASWEGCIPVMLSLSPQSLSSPRMPASVHKLIPRHSYLHVALEEEVRNFHQYAPISFQSNGGMTSAVQDDDDNEDSNSDSSRNQENKSANGSSNGSKSTGQSKTQSKEASYPKCWFEDERTGSPLRWHLFIGVLYDLLRLRESATCKDSYLLLPWKIKIHFTAYPEKLLPITNSDKDNIPQYIFQHYLNSLKQSLYLQYNSARIAKNMNKHSHELLWNGIKNNKWGGPFQETSSEFNGRDLPNNIPIRVMVDGRPSFSRPCSPKSENGEQLTIEHIIREWLPGIFDKQFRWCVQGIKVPLECPLVELWKVLSHPDRFLYVLVTVDDLVPSKHNT